MKNRVALLAASALLLALPAFAQRPEDRRPNEQRGEEKHDHERGPNAPRANQGRIPDPPQRREYMLYNVHTGQYVHVMYMGS